MSAALKTAKTSAVLKSSKAPSIEAGPSPVLPGHSVYGVLVAMRKGSLTLRTRAGKLVTVDNREAVKRYHSIIPVVGHALLVRGDYDKAGVLHATAIMRAGETKALWGKDN